MKKTIFGALTGALLMTAMVGCGHDKKDTAKPAATQPDMAPPMVPPPAQ